MDFTETELEGIENIDYPEKYDMYSEEEKIAWGFGQGVSAAVGRLRELMLKKSLEETLFGLMTGGTTIADQIAEDRGYRSERHVQALLELSSLFDRTHCDWHQEKEALAQNMDLMVLLAAALAKRVRASIEPKEQ
jgi:hypothetical protein